MPQYTLLQIVQKILSDMDGEEVNSIGDSTEATQIASIVEDTFYNLVTNRKLPEHNELIKLTALSDSNYPSHFRVPDGTYRITNVSYDASTDSSFEYKSIKWCEPEDFLDLVDSASGTAGTDYKNVSDKNAGSNFRIRLDRMPSYYTSFDDYYIVMDSLDQAIDSTLQTSKVRAMATVIPTFDATNDDYVPDVDANFHPLLLAESKSVAFSLLKGGPDPKLEQASRRQRADISDDLYNMKKSRSISKYGRT
jgi:hypothetical protein